MLKQRSSFLPRSFLRDFVPELTLFLQRVERCKPFWPLLPLLCSLITVARTYFYLKLSASLWTSSSSNCWQPSGLHQNSRAKIWMILKVSYFKEELTTSRAQHEMVFSVLFSFCQLLNTSGNDLKKSDSKRLKIPTENKHLLSLSFRLH